MSENKDGVGQSSIRRTGEAPIQGTGEAARVMDAHINQSNFYQEQVKKPDPKFPISNEDKNYEK